MQAPNPTGLRFLAGRAIFRLTDSRDDGIDCEASRGPSLTAACFGKHLPRIARR
jgi:hypothetical protein